MRALTLTQPWATLVAVGAKRIETRSWSTPYRGPVAIHAAVGLGPVGGMRGLTALIEADPFFRVLRPHLSGYTAQERARDLPRGAVVAVAELADVLPTEAFAPASATGWLLTEEEAAFGDYRRGRYAWILKDIANLGDGIECKGALGLWKLPKAVLEELAEIDDRCAP